MKGFGGRGLVLPGADSPLPALQDRYRRLAVQAFAKLGPRLPVALRGEHRRACAKIQEMLKTSPREILETFGRPEICAPLHCELAGYADSPFREPLDAALKRTVAVVLSGPGERDDRPVPGFVPLSLSDRNPIAALEEHPDKKGSVADLGNKTVKEWLAGLGKASGLVAAGMPELHAEMLAVLKQVVPVGWHAEKHFSASYREAVGTIYLSLHPDTLTMAEAMIHEFQHNKLYLASHADPILKNAFTTRVPSPIRPDPRPLWGVLLAVHAFLPVAAFARRLPTVPPGHLEELDLKNAEGMDVLEKHGDWTPAGRALFAELTALYRAHGGRPKTGRIAAAHEA